MKSIQDIWLVRNPASGSNDEGALATIEQACANGGMCLARHILFPDEPLPTAAELDAAGIGHVAVFAGDGTVHALVTSLYGWGGTVLVLPGGTMNLLFHRLHGDASLEEVIARLGSQEGRLVRPTVVRSRQGDSLSGSLAGPGTKWNDVREAMREVDIAAIAGGAVDAISETLASPTIRIVEPALGKDEGYPLVMMTPVGEGIELAAYYAESLGEFISQGWALLKRDFREGPHDTFLVADRFSLRSAADEEIGLLIDGEPFDAGVSEDFWLAQCEVDLLATVE